MAGCLVQAWRYLAQEPVGFQGFSQGLCCPVPGYPSASCVHPATPWSIPPTQGPGTRSRALAAGCPVLFVGGGDPVVTASWGLADSGQNAAGIPRIPEPSRFGVWWVPCFASWVTQTFHPGVKEYGAGPVMLQALCREYRLF